MITGQHLIEWGYTPGPWFKQAIAEANRLYSGGADVRDVRLALDGYAPSPVATLQRHARGTTPYFVNIEAEQPGDAENIASVREHMNELMRVPTIKAGAIMPDACPAGSAKGTIPVGGVVACENAIHPGFHSSDVCCSMAITVLNGDVSHREVLDAAMRTTHFGPGGRYDDIFRLPSFLLEEIDSNPFTEPLMRHARQHYGTQGDGNHFFYVGTLASTGQVAIVTHHGSRGFGARVYKAGMRVAQYQTKKIAPSVPSHQAWIVADSDEGRDYWQALQICRKWTKENHFAIHNRTLDAAGISTLRVDGRMWNEHNFVFQKSDGLFYHAKGATPAFPGFAADTNGLTLVPLNMSEPILLTRGRNAEHGLGFSPHGAGRNYSRTAFKKKLADGAAESGLPPTLDARWFSGTPDVSEMPGGYKSAAQVRSQIARFGLADVVDQVLPYGCIMAGEIDWRRAGKELGDLA